jgi:protein-L-isoaspartate O-methyltransferase
VSIGVSHEKSGFQYDNWSATYDADANLTRDLDEVVTREILMGMRCKSVIEIGCGISKNTLMLSKIAEKVYAFTYIAPSSRSAMVSNAAATSAAIVLT